MSSKTLLQTLSSLERELLDPNTLGYRERLAAVIHPDFREFGVFGAYFTKASVIEQLLLAKTPTIVKMQDFQALELTEGCVLLTYKSATLSPNGSLERHALRASVWKFGSSGWQILFHQGTLTSAFVPAES